MGSSVNNIVYSTNQGLPVKNLKQAILEWGNIYGNLNTLSYDNFFLRDGMVWTGKISPKKPVTVACLSIIDPHTNRGVIGLLNDSSGGTIAGNEFKARFEKALWSELKKVGINAAIYDNRVEFVIVLDGNIDPKTMASIFRKAIDQVNPEFQTMINGRKQTIRFFENDRMPPQVKFGHSAIDSACSAEELKAVTDKLFDLVKSKKFGPYDFKALLENIKIYEPYKIQKIDLVDANWQIVNKNWNHYKFAFYECMELLPDEFESKLKQSLENYGIEIDPKTKEYLLLRNRQLYVNEPTGALNRAAFKKAAGKVLAEKPANTWIAGGDIYNVTALNGTIGRTLTDNYLKTFIETWKEVANRFGVEMEIFRIGGDEIAFIIKNADAEKIARMNIIFNGKMNAKKVLPDGLLEKIPKKEIELLVKSGIIERGKGGQIVVKDVRYADIARKYSKIKGVVTKGSQYSFFAEKISKNEKRLDPVHVKESILRAASEHSKKVDSKTTIIMKQDEGFVVMEPEGIKCYSDYSMHKINPSSDNIKAVKKFMVDPKAQLISIKNPSANLKVETYRLPDGKEVTIQTEIFKDRVEIKTGDKLMKLKSPANTVSSKINLNKALFKNPDEIYARIKELQKQGWSDSRILEDAIKTLEDAGQAEYVAQVKLLNKLGRVVAPLGVAAMLYGIHMINEAPIEKRGELFAGFAAGFGTFTAGAQLGYKVIPGNPFWKAGGALIFGTVFAVIGDTAMRKFIDSNPKIKEISESKAVQAFAFMVKAADPINIYQTKIKSDEYKQKMKFVAEYGAMAWDEKIDNQLKPLKEELAVIYNEINKPVAPANSQAIDGKKIEKRYNELVREYKKIASEIKELEPQKYNFDPKNFTPEALKDIDKSLKDGAKYGSYNLALKG